MPVGKLLSLFESHQLTDKNTRSRADVNAWQVVFEEAYNPQTGALRRYTRPRDRPHGVLRRELYSIMKSRLHKICSTKQQANASASDVEERGSRLFSDWDLILTEESMERNDGNMSHSQNQAAMHGTEDRAGMVPSPPSLHMENTNASANGEGIEG